MSEKAVVFNCQQSPLVGIIHQPEQPAKTGVIIIVAGGPQYRVGAHRQFVTLGRQLASKGIPSLRFDHRGTGDSSGEYRGFVDMDADIKAAIEALLKEYPQLERIALWGECESASAAAFYAYNDDRVSGLFLVNPWIRTQAGQAKTYLKHYYRNRLRDPKFWRKLRSGEFSILRSLKAYLKLRSEAQTQQGSTVQQDNFKDLPLPERLTRSLKHFNGNTYIVTSGNDYIAQEFKDFMASSELWKGAGINERTTFHDMADADHTFSRTEWRVELFQHTEEWLLSDQ